MCKWILVYINPTTHNLYNNFNNIVHTDNLHAFTWSLTFHEFLLNFTQKCSCSVQLLKNGWYRVLLMTLWSRGYLICGIRRIRVRWTQYSTSGTSKKTFSSSYIFLFLRYSFYKVVSIIYCKKKKKCTRIVNGQSWTQNGNKNAI